MGAFDVRALGLDLAQPAAGAVAADGLRGDGARPRVVRLAARVAADRVAEGDRARRLEARDRARGELAQLARIDAPRPGGAARSPTTSSPKRSLGRPTTTASTTSAWRRSTSSTSSTKIFSPPLFTTSESRPRSTICPSGVRRARSPGTATRSPSMIGKPGEAGARRRPPRGPPRLLPDQHVAVGCGAASDLERRRTGTNALVSIAVSGARLGTSERLQDLRRPARRPRRPRHAWTGTQVVRLRTQLVDHGRRANASPTIDMRLTRSRATVSRMVRASIRGCGVVVQDDSSSSPRSGSPTNAVHCAAACISGGAVEPVHAADAARPHDQRLPDASSAPPIAATKMSLWRHSTAFGDPVVPRRADEAQIVGRGTGRSASVGGRARRRLVEGRAAPASGAAPEPSSTSTRQEHRRRPARRLGDERGERAVVDDGLGVEPCRAGSAPRRAGSAD